MGNLTCDTSGNLSRETHTADRALIKLCARAMDFTIGWNNYLQLFQFVSGPVGHHYDPLHDDAQAMALVKRFLLGTQYMGNGVWVVWFSGPDEDSRVPQSQHAKGPDLNRAIVECVAKMRAARTTTEVSEASQENATAK